MLKKEEEERQRKIQEEENKQKQDQEIKELIVVQDMEVEQGKKSQYVDLIPITKHIITQSSPPLTNGKAPGDKEQIAPLDDSPFMGI